MFKKKCGHGPVVKESSRLVSAIGSRSAGNLSNQPVERQRHLIASENSKISTGIVRAKSRITASVLEKYKKLRRPQRAISDTSNKHVGKTIKSTHQSVSGQNKSLQNKNCKVESKSIAEDANLSQDAVLDIIYSTSSKHPIPLPVVCDKLTFTFGDKTTVNSEFMSALDDLSVKSTDYPYLKKFNSEKSAYQLNYHVVSPSGKNLAILQVNSINKKTNAFRFDFNPSLINSSGIAQIRHVLKALFGSGFRALLGDGNITMIHAALDIKKQSINDLLVYSNEACSSGSWYRKFKKSGGEEFYIATQYVGTVSSPVYVRGYDKGLQLFEVKGVIPEGPLSRIEVCCKPRKNNVSLRVKELSQLGNPFEQFSLSYYPIDSETLDPWFKFFLSRVREVGAAKALLDVKNRTKRASFRRYLTDKQVAWWNPSLFWQQLMDHLQSTGLFPLASFCRDDEACRR